jgi:hypothetical protein
VMCVGWGGVAGWVGGLQQAPKQATGVRAAVLGLLVVNQDKHAPHCCTRRSRWGRARCSSTAQSGSCWCQLGWAARSSCVSGAAHPTCLDPGRPLLSLLSHSGDGDRPHPPAPGG